METASLAGVAGRTVLIDFEQYGISVAIIKNIGHSLRVARRFTLDPQ